MRAGQVVGLSGLAVVCGLALAGCGGGSASGGGGTTPVETQAATPVFSVAAGTYTSVQTVTITDATPGATIYYNTTPGVPPSAMSTAYTGPVRVGETETLSAVAVAAGYTGSVVQSVPYVINLPTNGKVYASQKALAGAHVYVMAASTTGYGGAGLAAGTGNASVSLLNAALTGQSDAVGAYVPTNQDGTFSIAGDYTCTPGTQVYLYALGGSTGAGTNTAIGLLAALGACPAAGNFGSNLYAVVNEVSTVATAYALAGFATDATHVGSSGTALAKVGIANAFANAANLETLGTGVALAVTPAGNGTVPQTKIDTLANVLVSCTSTSAAGSNGCGLLFGYTLSGGLTGTPPTDTASAAINIAHNPAANVADMWGVGSGVTFAPTLGAQPNDWTVALSFSGGGLSSPVGLAVDGAGDVWAANQTGSAGVSELSPLGAPLSPATGYLGGGLNTPLNLAIDPAGNAWVTNVGSANLSEFSSAGAALSPAGGYVGGGLGDAGQLAIDGSGNAWEASGTNNAVAEFTNAGVALSPSAGFTGGGVNQPTGIAIDATGKAWVSNAQSGGVSEFSAAGAALSPSTAYKGGGLDDPYAIAIDATGDVWASNGYPSFTASLSKLSNSGVAISPTTGYVGGGLNRSTGLSIDGAGNVWVGNYGNNSLSEFTNAGVAVTPSTGYLGGGLSSATLVAADGSGNVWITNDAQTAEIVEFVGVGTPVVTPLAVGVKNNALGTRP